MEAETSKKCTHAAVARKQVMLRPILEVEMSTKRTLLWRGRLGHLKRIRKGAFRVAGAVQETCPSEMLGGQALDFLRRVAFFGASDLQFCLKRSKSARLPHFLNLTTSKPKQFCETSSIFEVGNIKNEAILRDFFKNGKLTAELTASYQCVSRFSYSICLKYCACHEKVCQVIRSAAPVTQNHLRKFRRIASLSTTTTTTTTTLLLQLQTQIQVYYAKHDTTLITLHYTNYIQLHYTTLITAHYTTLHPAGVAGKPLQANIAATPKNTNPTTFRSISGFAVPSVIHNNRPLLWASYF